VTRVAFVVDLGPSMYSMYFVCKQSQTITSLSSFHMFVRFRTVPFLGILLWVKTSSCCRRLSLLTHPDKNPHEEAASAGILVGKVEEIH